MRRREGWFRLVVSGILGLVFAASFLPRAADAVTVRISGTGGSIGGISEVARAFHAENPQIDVRILPSMGSGGGIRAALAGRLDIGISARPLTPGEEAMGGRGMPYARTAFVFAVNRTVPCDDITLDNAVAIYAGKIVRWKDGKPVRLVLRPSADTDCVMLRGMSPEMAAALETAHGREGMITARTDRESADRIERIPGTFGTTTLALVISEHRRIKVLSLSGVAPSGDSVRDGTYPYAKTFHLVTGPDPSPAARKFIDYLRSPKGMAILLRTGHTEPP